MDQTVFHNISYGMYVISTSYNGQNVGCTINSFSQITATDMVCMASLNKQNYTNTAIKSVKKFALSILSEDTNAGVIGKFGFSSSKDTNKFADYNYEYVQSLPVLNENCCGYLICEVVDVIDCGTHDIFLAKVIDAQKLNNLTPMTYSYYHKVVKGKAPKTAPTYIEEKEKNLMESKKYKCLLCGYIYDDATEEVKFEDLPADWHCPICGVGKEKFIEVK